MIIVKKILIPFDFSATSVNALNYAVSFANNEEEIELELLHVISTKSKSQKSMNADFKAIAAKHNDDLYKNIKWSIHDGNLIDTISKYWREQKFDLIIMGTKGTDDYGSTNTSKLIHKMDCPVLVVPKVYTKFTLKKIVLALDKNKINDADKLKILLDTTRRFDAKVKVLTVLSNGNAYSDADDHNENLLQYYLGGFYSDHSFIKSSDIEEGMFNYVKDQNIDMLTILPRNHAKNAAPSEGKLVGLIAKHSKIPVLILD